MCVLWTHQQAARSPHKNVTAFVAGRNKEQTGGVPNRPLRSGQEALEQDRHWAVAGQAGRIDLPEQGEVWTAALARPDVTASDGHGSGRAVQTHRAQTRCKGLALRGA